MDVETAHNNRFSNITVTSQNLAFRGMETGEKATVPCVFRSIFELSKDDPIVRGDIVLVVDFRPDFLLWRIQRRLRFVTLRGADGNLYWYPQPYSRLGQ